MSYGISYATNTPSAKEVSEDHIFCPEKIDCSEEGNIGSCKAVGDNLNYWGKMQENGRIIKGAYIFQAATSSYQVPSNWIDESRCDYYIRDESGNLKTIGLRVKEGANLEMLNLIKLWLKLKKFLDVNGVGNSIYCRSFAF